MARNDKNLQSVYNTLKNEGYTPPEYEEFVKDMQDDSNLQGVYETLKENGYEPPEFNVFKTDMFGAGELAGGQDGGAMSAVVGGVAGGLAVGAPPTEERKRAMGRELRQIRAQGEAMFAEGRERMANVAEYYRGNPIGFRTVEGEPVFNPESGTMEKTFLTPTGDRTRSKTAADMTAYSFRRAMGAADMSVGAQIRRAEAELAGLRKQYDGSKSRVHGEWAEDYEKNSAPLADVLAANTYAPRQAADKENSALRVAIRQREEQLKNLYEERDRQIGKDVGFWRGFGRVVGDGRTWDFGTGDLLDAMTMMNADQYSAPDATEGEKRAGKDMLKAVYDAQQTEQMFGENASFWNRAGVMTGYMPSFMLDFALTGGGYEVIDVAGKAATRGAVKIIGKEAIKEMTELGVKQYAKKYGVRGVGRMAENWTIKALGTTADDLLIRAPLMTNTVQAGKTTADIIDRKLGDVVVDANGNYDFSNDETWGSAIWQGEANAIIENYSEMFGTHLDGVAPVLAATFGGKRISGMLARANASSYGQILSTTRKQFERLGVSDYFGEVSEEYYGQLWRTMLNLDDAYTNVPVYDEQGNQVVDEQGNPVYERKNLLFTGQFHGDIWGGMALSMGLMGAGKYTISGIAYGSMKHRVNVADRVAAEVFTPERWEPIREIIDSTTNDDIGALAESMVNDTELSERERVAVMEYMERSLNLRGLNLGAMAQGRGAEDEEGVELPTPVELDMDNEFSQSYIDGYEASSPQEMADAQNMYEYQRQRAEGMFESSVLESLDTNPVGALMDMARNGLYSQEEIDSARDYINAKTVRDGILQRVNDNIDEQIAQSDAMIKARVNPASGMIQPAVMGLDDRLVYVVGGTLAVNEDGTIDREASDESIVVRDAQTGELQFTDPKSIVSAGEAIDPEMEKAIAVDNIRQQAAQAAADAMNGTLAFNPGDVVEINDGGGLIQVTVLGPLVDEESGMPIDGQVMVQFPNGQQTAFAKEQLQSFADVANLERLNNFEQERAAARARQQSAEAEAMRPKFALNDEFTILNDNGTPIRGSITAELDEEGMVEIHTEEPINGNHVNRFTPTELEEMFDTYNGEAVSSVVEGEGRGELAPEHDGGAGVEQPETALSRVPVDEQGDPILTHESVDPETAWAGAVEFFGSEDDALAYVNAQIKRSEARIASAEKAVGKIKPVGGMSKYREDLKNARAVVEEAKLMQTRWQEIACVQQLRMAEAEAEKRASIEAELNYSLSDEVDENGRQFVLSSNGDLEFGSISGIENLEDAPILLSEGMITNTKTNDGYGLVHIEARHGAQIRGLGYKSVLDFIEEVARNYHTIRKGAVRNGRQTYMLQLTDRHNNTLMVELANDGAYYIINTAGAFKMSYGKNREIVYDRHTTATQSAETAEESQKPTQSGTSDNSRMISPAQSDDKVKVLSTEKQGAGEESFESGPADESAGREQTLGAAVAAAEAVVDTDPTPAQKEAGNYKKGHVQVGTFDVTIEQPVGSVRRGTDADGKEWETTMQNTYGYIRGTEGVDGDHIDVFLSDNIDGWNGRRVVIVDQYNPDGTFDEHKVMLGFNDKDDAVNAYLANYENGWERGRRLVFSTAALEDFEKWIESSHRKQKPYHEYKIAEKAEVEESNPENPVSTTEQEAPADYTIDTYTTKKGKTYHRVVFPRADKAVWQERLNLAKKMGGTSVPKGYGFKTKEEAEAFAKAVAEVKPLSLDDMRQQTSEGAADESAEREQTQLTDKVVNPSGNKLVTDERYAELRERMRKKLGGQLNMGVDPEILAIGTEMAVYHIEKGARKFSAYASAMIADLGDAIRPYLKSFYNAVRDMPEAEAAGLVADMDSYDDVRSVDIANFDKPSTDALATAAAVVAELEAEKEREEAEAKLKEKRKKRANPATDLMGDSAAYQEREAQTVELVEEIGSTIENRVAMLQLDPESVKPLTMTDVKKMASKYPALKDISDTDLQELVELAMTQLTRSEALVNIEGTGEQQRAAFDRIVNLYQMQPSLNARDSERLIKQQYSTPTPFGFVMGQFVRAGGKEVDSMLEPSAGNGALTITVQPSSIHVNDIDEVRLANLRKLGYGRVTAQDALLPFSGEKVDVVMTNPPFGTVTEKVYDDIFRISSLEGQMAINALEQMKDDGRAAFVIGGNTSYRTNGSMNPKDAAFFGYLYSHYNVVDVINISGKALYSRNGTGYDVRMILIDGRKTGEFQRVYPPVKTKARAEQITTFDELYKRVQDDIQQIQQVGSQSANVQREPGTAVDGTASAPVRTGNNRPNTGAGQRPGTTGDTVRDTPRTDSGQPIPGNDGSSPAGVDNAVTGNAGSTDNVPQPKPQQPRSVGSGSAQDGTGRSGSDGRGTVASRPDRRAERLEVKPDLTTEKVPYPNQSENGFTLMSVVPAAQAQVLQKSLGEIAAYSGGELKVGDVDQYLVDELGYSSKEELYQYLAAEQIDSVALAIHQMDKGNAFIIGDMTGVGKGRQGAALIRYAVKQGKVPIYFTQKPTLFTDNYRDLADIGSSDLRPFIIASNPKDANIVDTDGNIVHKLPSKKEQERVFNYIMEHGTLPEEYDYVLTTYDQIKNGTADYAQNEDGTWNVEARKLPKNSKGYTTADHNGQARRDALAQLAEGNIAILDESHTVGGDSGCGRYMQMLTSSAEGVTFLSATFAKRADNMPIYAQRTAIAEAGVKASELIDAIMKGGVTLQEIMSKQLVESGQMIRRERSFDGVTIDWLSVEEETDRRQRQQFNEVADIFNAIRNFQDDYITPIIDAKNEAAAEFGATVGHTQGTKDMGVKNVPFASKMYNLVNQLLFALKVDAVADRVVENLRNGYKPVISFTNTMEGFLSSAPKGVAMDDVPNFSLTLMRALDGVMRFTEKDADENTEGGSISLNELTTEGQNVYNAIREKIVNLSADLPISPMDAIRMKIEEAGYSVAEITGRTMQLNRTDDGRYIVEARKDRDKKAAMRDFNAGKLDVLMINKSGSTGISLHASSKFEDQRPRVMVFAQFQSDINDEVQMRGRIDRSGQVTRGRYEYIMSTIPAEQRIQMMFKAKLKSLDANTTSSQKSKFNEMEIVDYLNKYGDEVVWEYMKEHPELEERLGDPLDMLQEKNDEDGPRTSEKEDTSKKSGCAGKISRYLAFLSVDEQDEIFREITEAYRVKIQLLDDAGENDLEITTMPLRAETKRKQIWHEGENPGSGNAFADNTYVEEVEVDVLKKPMKRAEIEEATRKLVGEKGIATEYDQQRYGFKEGEVNWNRYAETMQSEIDQFFQTKADEAVAKLKEAGDARVAKTREKAVAAATKARSRGENNFSDEEIQSLADTVANEAREKETYKQRKRREEIMAVRDCIKSLFTNLRAGNIYVVPQDLKQATPEMFSQTFGTFVGFKFNKGYTLGSSTAIFATLDGRRKVELALSDPGLQTIIGATNIAYRYSPKEINAINMENWDSKVPTQTRQKRYIITGNLLQALVDTEKGEKTRGNLISYSTIDGETRQGILMGENFKLTDLRNSASLSSRLAQIREGKAVVSENGDVQIEKVSFGWQHRGQYELRVPKSKQRGGVYSMAPDLLKLVDGHNFITKGNNMVAYVDEADIAKVVDMLSRAPFNLTVLQESKLSDVSAEDTEVLYRGGETSVEGIVSAKDMAKLGASDRQAVAEFIRNMPCAKISVIKNTDDVDSESDLSDEAKAELLSTVEAGDTVGAYCHQNKKIYIFANRSQREAVGFTIQSTLVHENAHYLADKMDDIDESYLNRFAEAVDQMPSMFFRNLREKLLSVGYDKDDLPGEIFALTLQWLFQKPKSIDRLKGLLSVADAKIFEKIITEQYGEEGRYKDTVIDGFKHRTDEETNLNGFSRANVEAGPGLGRDRGELGRGERDLSSESGFVDETIRDNANEYRTTEAVRGVLPGRSRGDASSAGIDGFTHRTDEIGGAGRDSGADLTRKGDGYGAYSDAEVSFANDPISKVMGKNRFSKKRQAEFAERERQRMAARIVALASKLNLDEGQLEVVTDLSQLDGRHAKAKGFYNKRTGRITIVLPNHLSMIDTEQTLLHEAVAHYGLRKLFGEQFNTFLDNVYDSADEGIRRKIAEMAAKNGWDFRTATEEYLASLAEDTNFEQARSYDGWWSKVKRLFLDMLDKIGFEGFRDKVGVVLTDNELRYILWRSYENLAEPGRYRSILGEAADVAKQSELKVGNYAEGGIEAEYAAEPSNIEVISERFNDDLRKYENGTLAQGHRFELGMPSRYLRSAGFPNLPISMRASLLKLKSGLGRHPFEAKELRGLVESMQKPIAIFSYTKDNVRNIIVDVKHGDKHFLVGVTLNYKAGEIEINSVSGLFPKDNHEWLKWIQDGKVIRIDQKEKVQQIIDSLRMNPGEAERIGLNLEDVAKIVENFENPTIEDEELFRLGDFSPRDRVFARYAYEGVVRSGSYQFKEAVQDSMLGLKELYKAISDGAETAGHKQNFRIEDVPGFENAYLFENRMSSMNAGEQHEYFQRYMQPLLKEIGRIAGANERKRRELTDYIMAKHGLERNEYMRNEAAANGEDTERDFAGLIGLTGDADWLSAEDTARQWVDDYESMNDTTALWEAINKATKATLEKVYLSGIISKETYEKILGMYDYYVPLRGWNETTSDEVYGYLTSKDGPLGGSIMKKAEGRESMADDPIATIGMMADDAIRQGNRNLMKQRFLNFILNHPSDAVSVHDLWLEYNDVTDEWVPVFADVEETDTAEVVEQKVKDFEERMEALRTAEPDKYKRGREAQHIPYKVVRGNLREHQILIKRNGRTFVATINGNPRAAQAINGLTNPDVDQNGVVGNMLKAGTWVNRQLSAFYTTRNPDFVVGNFFRDMLYSNCMTWVKESPRYARRFHKNFGRVNPIVMRRLLGKWENGTLNMGNRLESIFYQFMKNGGETGYTNVRDIEGHKRAVAAELKKQGSTGRRVWTALGMQLDLLNRSAENSARFAAFITSRDFGRSIDRAIYDAKEISVNFNKKGSGGKMVNANGQTALGKTGAYLSGGGRLLYVFWNAGVQGMTNFGRQAKRHPAKFSVGATALFTLGYVIPILAQMLGGGDGDDDDKNAYYNLPEYVRRSNICFYAGDQWITIPLPIEYRAMYGMGELAHGVISGNERYSDSELARQMASQVSQIMPIDMLEGGGGISPFIPSAAKPFTEAYIMNKGWTGLPVYKDTPFNKNDPEWTKAYASADKHLVAFAKWLNETSGGDDFKKGSIDINPAKIEYLLNGTFGGLFTFPNKIKKSGETMFGDREFEWRNMPIANRLIKSGDERTANRKLQNEYFKYLKEYEATGQLMRKYENADEDGIMGYAERINFLENSPEYARWEIFDEFKADIDAYREDIAAETDKEERKRIEAEMYAVMRELVNALHDPEGYRNREQE